MRIVNKKNNSKKTLTLEDLAQMMTSGFERVDKRFEESRRHTKKVVNEKIEWLATTTQNNFLSIEGRLDTLEESVEDLKNGQADIKANLNKKVDVFSHKELEYRVEKVEEKVGIARKKSA